MCGLIGLLDSSGTSGDELRQRVLRMAERIAHRGPDGDGGWAESGIALGHRRLAILDLSPAGAQPMHSACARYVLAFNGEIYNHLDLRRELSGADGQLMWRGHSDTETLLACIAAWGLDETLERSAGMFALALWDRRDQRLSLARDRLGEKPLYWGWVGTDLAFASELKALHAHPGFTKEICQAALHQYLQFAYVPAPLSIFTGIYKLEPGTILEVRGSPPKAPPSSPLRPGQTHENIAVRRYWSLNETIEAGARDPVKSEDEAVGHLESLLSLSIRRQMLSDVPLGAFLSGGIDSSTVVALMQLQSDRAVKTFTIGFEDTKFDESPYAAAVARHLGTDHTCLRVTEADAQAVVPDLPKLYDEPFADSSQIPTHIVSRVARSQVTVALSGDGGDELFGGYNRYILGPKIWRHISWLPFPLRRALGASALAVSASAWDRIGADYNRFRPSSAGISNLGTKVHRVADRLHRVSSIDDLHKDMISFWLAPGEVMSSPLKRGAPKSTLDDELPHAGVEHSAARMMVQDMRTYLPDDILCKVDRAAMGVSLETRVPFLDPELVAFAARVPLSMKIRDGAGKWPLRQVLYRHVPRELIDRPKAGFAIPIGAWLKGPLREWAEELLSVRSLSEDGLLNPTPIRQCWAEHLSGRRDWSDRLWIVLMLQAWRESVR